MRYFNLIFFLVLPFLTHSQTLEEVFSEARGIVYSQKNENKAFKIFDSIQKAPNVNDSIKSDALFWMGQIKRTSIELIDYGMSKKYYLKSLELNENNQFSLIGIANLYHRQFNNTKKANEYFKKGMQLDYSTAFFGYNEINPDSTLTDSFKAIVLEKLNKKLIDFDYDNVISKQDSLLNLTYYADAYWNYKYSQYEGMGFTDQKYYEESAEYWEDIIRNYKNSIDFGRKLPYGGTFKSMKNLYTPSDFSTLGNIYSEYFKDYKKALKNYDSAIYYAKRYGTDPSSYLNNKLELAIKINDNKLIKSIQDSIEKNIEYYYSREFYDNKKFKLFNSLVPDWSYFYPYENFNRKENPILDEDFDDTILPLNLSISINLNDIGNIELQGENRNTFDHNFDLKIGGIYDGPYEMDNDTLQFTDFKKNIKFYKDIKYDTIIDEYDFIRTKFYNNWLSIKGKSDMIWKLRDFPFDKQKLPIKVKINADTSIYRLSHSKFFDSKVSEILPSLDEGYEVSGIDFEENFVEQNIKGYFFPGIERNVVFSEGVFNVILKRKGGWLFFKLFVGAILSFILSCLVFLIPKDNFGSRIDLTLGAIFGSVGNKYFVESATTMTQVLTKADLINNLIVFLVMLNVVIVIMQDNDKLNFGKFEDSKFALVFSICIMVLSTSIILLI